MLGSPAVEVAKESGSAEILDVKEHPIQETNSSQVKDRGTKRDSESLDVVADEVSGGAGAEGVDLVAWRRQLDVGSRCDSQCLQTGKWYRGRIVAVSSEQESEDSSEFEGASQAMLDRRSAQLGTPPSGPVLVGDEDWIQVHYDGWGGSKWDVWLRRWSTAVLPLHTRTKPVVRAKLKKRRTCMWVAPTTASKALFAEGAVVTLAQVETSKEEAASAAAAATAAQSKADELTAAAASATAAAQVSADAETEKCAADAHTAAAAARAAAAEAATISSQKEGYAAAVVAAFRLNPDSNEIDGSNIMKDGARRRRSAVKPLLPPAPARKSSKLDKGKKVKAEATGEEEAGGRGSDTNDLICSICDEMEHDEGSDILCCDGPCLRSFHLACLGLDRIPDQERWFCDDCLHQRASCWICGGTAAPAATLAIADVKQEQQKQALALAMASSAKAAAAAAASPAAPAAAAPSSSPRRSSRRHSLPRKLQDDDVGGSSRQQEKKQEQQVVEAEVEGREAWEASHVFSCSTRSCGRSYHLQCLRNYELSIVRYTYTKVTPMLLQRARKQQQQQQKPGEQEETDVLPPQLRCPEVQLLVEGGEVPVGASASTQGRGGGRGKKGKAKAKAVSKVGGKKEVPVDPTFVLPAGAFPDLLPLPQAQEQGPSVCVERKGKSTVLNVLTSFRCPAHVCHTCEEKTSSSRGRVYSCVKCPTAYHQACTPPSASQNLLFMLCGNHGPDAALPSVPAMYYEDEDIGRELAFNPQSSTSALSHAAVSGIVCNSAAANGWAAPKGWPAIHFPANSPDPAHLSDHRHFRLPSAILSEVQSRPPPFQKISSLLYLIPKPPHDPAPPAVCKCENVCGDDCLNRILTIECVGDGPGGKKSSGSALNNCGVGRGCGNRQMQQRAYAPLVPINAHGKGWGLHSTADIHRGQLVVEYVGEVLDDAAINHRLEEHTRLHKRDKNMYIMELMSGVYIDARHKGNCSRFINHSCDPNCELQKWTVGRSTRIGIYAVRDIKATEELSYDYQFFTQESNKFICLCGSANCRGTLAPAPRAAPASRRNRLEEQQAEIDAKDGKMSKRRIRELVKARKQLLEEEANRKRVEEMKLLRKQSATSRMLPGDQLLEVRGGPPVKYWPLARSNRLFLPRNGRMGNSFLERKQLWDARVKLAQDDRAIRKAEGSGEKQ